MQRGFEQVDAVVCIDTCDSRLLLYAMEQSILVLFGFILGFGLVGEELFDFKHLLSFFFRFNRFFLLQSCINFSFLWFGILDESYLPLGSWCGSGKDSGRRKQVL